MKKSSLITILIILAVIIFYLLIKSPSQNIDSETAKCIGENSVLYTQLGCHACEIQKDMFGPNYKHLSVVDCFYEQDKCFGITATPTWVIDGKKHLGVQSIEKLKELTRC